MFTNNLLKSLCEKTGGENICELSLKNTSPSSILRLAPQLIHIGRRQNIKYDQIQIDPKTFHFNQNKLKLKNLVSKE